jgi:cytochrome c oxidase cbb3-type subunit 4
MVEIYAYLAWIAQSVGLLAFMAAFLAISAYALWPSNRAKFARAAATPLAEEEDR